MMLGCYILYILGWDMYGLLIENEVIKSGVDCK